MEETGHTMFSGPFWEALREWHTELADDRGARAALRRAQTPTEVFISPEFQRGLLGRMEARGVKLPYSQRERLALAAGVLAHARILLEEDSFGRFFAGLDKGSREARDMRFRKLLAVDDPEGLYRALLRLTRYMDLSIPLQGLVRGATYWNDITKRRWANDYYTLDSNR
ncbi:MAG: type I-E CRISPR-associated protein Cse2/CasB [Thermodesulfobacteriota bacterium]